MAASLKALLAVEVPHLVDDVTGAPAATAPVSVAAPPQPKKKRFQVIGHRGNGMNAAAVPRLSAVKENSIRSFNEAGRFPVDLVEFDVQVTRDGHPVIFHDLTILTAADDDTAVVSEKRLADLTLQEFLSYGPPHMEGDDRGNPTNNNKPLLRRGKDGSVSRWAVDADDALCTLQEAFDKVDSHLGFNIELKFDDDFNYRDEELLLALRSIYKVISDHAGERPVVFSTFHPDAARLMRGLQGIYPVLFLTDAGTEMYTDPRRNSLESAIELCQQEGLQGIVSEVKGVFQDPSAIARVKAAGLALFTYGEMNNAAEAVLVQQLMGVDGVIVDLVPEVTAAIAGGLGLGCDEWFLGRHLQPAELPSSLLLKLCDASLGQKVGVLLNVKPSMRRGQRSQEPS